MADEVKLITFAGETVSPLYDGLMQELYTGGGGIITGAVVTIKDASTLHITGGYGALCGREFEIFASDIPVTLSSSGTLKGRLYLHMDLAQSGAPIELLVEVASSLTPVVQDSDVNTTNGVYEVNLATFDVGTSAISNLVDVSPKLSKIPDQISSLNSALTNVGKYSTTGEVEIGTYNGSKLYRKVYSSTGTGARSVPFSGFNKNKIVKLTATLIYGVFASEPYYAAASDWWNYYVNDNNASIVLRGAGSAMNENSTFIVIVEYTK